MPLTPILDELELDALTELINLGVSQAANSLRDMSGREVLLTVPRVLMVPRKEAVETLREREPGLLVGICQDFTGDISGKALLIFPNAKSFDLVRAVISDLLPEEDIAALQHEALSEIGNIILNGCFATIANQLDRTFQMSLPAVSRGDAAQVLQLSDDPVGGQVLFLYINFTIQDHDIRGYIAIVMDVPVISSLKVLLQDYIARMT